MLASSQLAGRTQTISNNPLPRNWRVASFPKRATIRCASLTGKTSLGWFYGLFTCDSLRMFDGDDITYALFDLFGGFVIDQCSHDMWVPDMLFWWMDGCWDKQFQRDLINHRFGEMKHVMKWRAFLLLFLVNHGSSKSWGIQFEMSSISVPCLPTTGKTWWRWESIPIKETWRKLVGKRWQGQGGLRSDKMPLLWLTQATEHERWQATGHTSCAPNVANLAFEVKQDGKVGVAKMIGIIWEGIAPVLQDPI